MIPTPGVESPLADSRQVPNDAYVREDGEGADDRDDAPVSHPEQRDEGGDEGGPVASDTLELESREDEPAISPGEDTPLSGQPPLPGVTKAAIFILSLDEEAATRVLRCLSDDELGLVAAEIARLGVIDTGRVDRVRAEFEGIQGEADIVQEGGVAPASRLLGKVLPPARARRLLEWIGPGRPRRRLAFLGRGRVDAGSIAALLRGEHPATVAAVLAHTPPATASRVLERLPDALRRDTLGRISELGPVHDDAFEAIAAVLRSQLGAARFVGSEGAGGGAAVGGVETAAEILRAGGGQAGRALAADLREERPDLAGAVEKRLFAFADLASISDVAIRRALEGIDVRVLALALRNCEARIAAKLLRGLPRRQAAQVRRRRAGLAPVTLREVEDARTQVVEFVLERLDAEAAPTGDGQARAVGVGR